LGDVAFEIEILNRMILGAHRKALLAERQARTAGDGPALEHAVELQAEIEVQPARGMHLHHELMTVGGAELRGRLGRAGEIALL
jgi:hypothetical protein